MLDLRSTFLSSVSSCNELFFDVLRTLFSTMGDFDIVVDECLTCFVYIGCTLRQSPAVCLKDMFGVEEARTTTLYMS